MGSKPMSATRAAKRALKKQGAAHRSHFSISKTNIMSKTKNAVLTAQQEKQLRVGYTVFITDPKLGSRRLDFSSDLNRFRTTFKHVSDMKELQFNVVEIYHGLVMNMFKIDQPDNEEFYTACMHYIATRQSASTILQSNPSEGIGFMISINSEDPDGAEVIVTDYKYWFAMIEKAREEYYKNN